MTDIATDAKAGFCSNCRRDDHALCASASCTCPDRRRHRNRPGFGAVDATTAPPPRPLRPVGEARKALPTPTKTAPAAPVIELVAEEPPEPPERLTVVEQIVRAITDGLPVGDQWFRVVIMPTPRAAKALATQLTKHEVTQRMALEWRAAEAKVFVKGPA